MHTQLVSDFVLASFKGKGDSQKAVDALALQYRRTEAYVTMPGANVMRKLPSICAQVGACDIYLHTTAT